MGAGTLGRRAGRGAVPVLCIAIALSAGCGRQDAQPWLAFGPTVPSAFGALDADLWSRPVADLPSRPDADLLSRPVADLLSRSDADLLSRSDADLLSRPDSPPLAWPPAVAPLRRYPPPDLTPVEYYGETPHRIEQRIERPWYIAIGVELYNTDTGELDTDNGHGGDLTVGRILPINSFARVSQALSLEGSFEAGFQSGPQPITGTEVNIHHLRFMAGFKWAFQHRPGERWRPYLTLGGAYHMVVFKNTLDVFDIDGSGPYIGLGLDYYPSEAFSVGFDAKGHIWRGTSDVVGFYYDVKSYTLSIKFAVHF